MAEQLEIVESLRVYLPTETLSSLFYKEQMVAKGMELPWKNNANNISCIPEGDYIVVYEESSPKHHYPHYRVLNVPKRNGILWHKITYVKDLLGCMGVGQAFKDLNGDNVPDMVGSTAGLQDLISVLPKKFIWRIKEKPKTV